MALSVWTKAGQGSNTACGTDRREILQVGSLTFHHSMRKHEVSQSVTP